VNEGLERLNAAVADDARQMLLRCCASRRWAAAVAAARPFANREALVDAARAAWAATDDAAKLEAFAAHPLIGDVEMLRHRLVRSGDRAYAEQGQVLGAADEVIETLASLNIGYRERHGFIFIVFASGKSAEEMLDILRARIDRSTAEELRAAAEEQMKITELRLDHLLSNPE
jgi:2-oxo-4-hydroxy-4-carboxy-5-ureidoimidazoline decarboxylase